MRPVPPRGGRSRRGEVPTRSGYWWALVVVPLVLLLVGRLRADDVTVEATVDSNDAIYNQAFVFRITINGAQNVSPPSLYDIDGFDVSYLGPDTQVSFVNGRMSASISHRYRVVPLRVGELTLGPFTVDVQGKSYETKAVPIHVAAAAAAPSGRRAAAPAPAGAQGVRLVVTPAKSEVYVGERVDLTVTLYVGNVRIRDLQYPVIAADGVTVDKFSQPTEGDSVLDGQRYHTVAIRTTMTPIRAGSVELNATMTMNMLTSRRRGMDAFFDQFFPGDTKPVEVRSEPTRLTVLPLPEQGKPADYAGAVGRFEFGLEAKPTELDVGDPITLRMEISGSGNLATVSAPPLPADDRFRTYDAQPVKGEDGAERRVFEQVVIPKVADVHELPAVRFSFFDPEARSYRTITRGPTPLTVRAGRAAKPEVVDAEQSAQAEPKAQPLGRDIVYIKDTPDGLAPRHAPIYQRGGFAALQLLPVALFSALWAYTRRRERLASDPRLVRFRQAGREVRRALAALNGGSAADARFYDELSAAVAAYLGAKLDLPPGAVERERVLARLSGDGCAAEMGERVGAFFQLVEHARYAPSAVTAAERGTALSLATAIVDGLERERRLERHLAAGVALAVLCAAALLSAARADETAPQAAFYQGNQAYAAGKYGEAIRAYESVRAAGWESGALEYNLGNAFFKDGQLARAIASYERARRLLPRDPDVQSNLGYALERAQVSVEPTPLWKRVLVPFATRATGSELAVFASLCWWVFWLLLAARLLQPRWRLGLGRAAWGAAALYLIVAGSLGMRLAETELRDTAIVTAPAGASVRFEPSATGTEHYPAASGTMLEVTEERDDWLQVRRADGRRGWIPRAAVERVQ